jgi:DNA-binding transcriptional LysR family regulator
VKVAGVFHSNSFLAIRRAAIAGLGIALLPAYFVSADLRSGSLKRILKALPAIERPVYILTPANQHTPKKIKMLVDFLAAWFRQRPWEKGLDDHLS